MNTNKRSFRPTSLREVAAIALAGESFDLSLANFLDEFYAMPQSSALNDEPPLLAPQFGWDGQVRDAYLAATAEELGRKHKLTIPAWVCDESRKLPQPLVRLYSCKPPCRSNSRKSRRIPFAKLIRERKRFKPCMSVQNPTTHSL